MKHMSDTEIPDFYKKFICNTFVVHSRLSMLECILVSLVAEKWGFCGFDAPNGQKLFCDLSSICGSFLGHKCTDS